MPTPIDNSQSLYVSDASTPREPAPAGLQQGVCVFAEDLGEAVTNFPGSPPKLQRKIILGFELAEKMEDGRPWMLSKEFTASLNDKATLTAYLQSWRGKRFTEAEKKQFDIRTLIGVNVMLNVMHKERKAGGMRADIAGLAPLIKNMETIGVYNTTLPDWIDKRREQNRQDVARFMAADAGHDDEEHGKPASSFDEVPF